MTARQIVLLSIIFLLVFCAPATGENGNAKSPPDAQAPSVEIVDDMAVYMKNEAAQVKKDLKHQANTLIKHTPLGWDVNTLDYAFEQAVMLPARLPQLAVPYF